MKNIAFDEQLISVDTQKPPCFKFSDNTLLENVIFREAKMMSFNLFEQHRIWIKL